MNDMQTFSSDLLGEAYHTLTHPSGLRVLVFPKDMATTYAMLGVQYGAAHIPASMPRGIPVGEKTPLGLAHFLEHKMFEEADGTSCDLRFAALGAEVNAYTSYDKTVYYVSATEHFDEALSELLLLVSKLDVTDASVRRERAIITEEIRMNRDSPFEKCYADLIRAMYQNHRVREEICGTEASVRSITPKLLRAHFDAFYKPQNMVLSVVGRVDATQIMRAVDAHFGAYTSAYPKPEILKCDEPALPANPYVQTVMQVPKPLFCIGVKVKDIPTDPQALFRRDLCMTVLSEMLFSRSGDFYNALFEAGEIAPSYAYGSALGEGYGYFALSGEGDHPHAVYKTFCQYIQDVKAQGLSREDFERSRRILYGDYVTSFDATEDIAQNLLTYAMDGVDLFSFIPTVESLTYEEISEFFEACFIPEQYALSVIASEEILQSKE